MFGQQCQEESDTDKGITAVMQFGIYDSAVAFAAYDSGSTLHLGSHIHFPDSCRGIGAAMCAGDIAQGARRA